MTVAFKFSKRSLDVLSGVRPEMQQLATLALKLSPVDFIVVNGMRSAAAQLAAYKAGKSKIKSGGRHQYGCAIDVQAINPVTGKGDWTTSTGFYHKIADAFAAAAKQLGLPYRWGGTFSFHDDGHHELPVSARFPNNLNWKKAT